MAEVAKKYLEKLPELKDFVEDSHNYFNQNVMRYRDFMRFVFKTSLSQSEASILQERGMPTLEFNILEAYISKQRGEFADLGKHN